MLLYNGKGPLAIVHDRGHNLSLSSLDRMTNNTSAAKITPEYVKVKIMEAWWKRHNSNNTTHNNPQINN